MSSNTLSYKYDLMNGVLLNGAKVDKISKMVSHIGGPYNGMVEIKVNVVDAGDYAISLFYRNSLRPFKISVDGKEKENIYKTASDYVGIFNTVINLNAGNNLIRFSGDGINYGPDLGELTVTSLSIMEDNNSLLFFDIFSIFKKFALSELNLSFGAKPDKFENLIDFLGGTNEGFATFEYKAPVTRDYILNMSYRNGNRTFRIEVNGVDTGKVYKTGFFIMGVFTTTVKLTKGENIIKFYGDGTKSAPDLGNFIIV
ncbi:hypothetical protein [Clostridium tarantellae]|uniref:CBM6 domain-containing protein n=1 Tax=Clostridium tarantellae TaxID=39493 RepID=A0A6I1MJS9_9CLOT|nr:hypothetical protein [Clostridium tarantellae]MPQ42963.1 hypothetical protein [Clostridium tarantellae]